MMVDLPPETMAEEREELMVSPLGGQETLRTAHFVKPSSASIEDIPPFSLSQNPDISSSIKKTRFEVQFKGRRCPQKNWETWVDRLLPTHRQIWEKAGIFEAIMASKYQIMRQNDLIIALSERWRPETNTFIFPWGESTLTLEDMMVLGGYSVLGSPVSTPLKTRDLIMVEEDLSRAHRKFKPGQGCYVAAHSAWLEHFMDTDNKCEHEAFLALWLSRYVLPTTYDTVSRAVLPVAIHLSRGTPIALAPAVLASIYRDLSLLKKSVISSLGLGGCESGKFTLQVWAPFQLVQVWAWERFPALRPKPNLIKPGDPRLARWHRLRYTKVENVRRELDSADDCFQWRPYAVAVKNWSFCKFYRENEEWATVDSDIDTELIALALCIRPSELVGLDCIEQYLAHRVSMQFGIDQDLPGHVPRFNESSEAAWRNYCRPLRDAKLYVPARLFESDVTARYFTWRTRPGFASDGAINKDVPSKVSSETRKRLPQVCRGNEVNDQDVVEDGEDSLTIAELVNGDQTKKKRKTLKDGLRAHDKPRPQSSSKGLQKPSDFGRMKDLDQTNQGDISIEDVNATELNENREDESNGLTGDDQPICDSSLSKGLQKGDLGREKDLNQTNRSVLSVEDGCLEKTNKNGEGESNGLTGKDKPICRNSSSEGLGKGDFARMNDLDQTNQGNKSVEDEKATELNGFSEKMKENREDESNSLTGDDEPICVNSSLSFKCLQEGDFARMNELDQTNEGNKSIEGVDTTELNGLLEKMNENRKDKSNGLTGVDEPICRSSSFKGFQIENLGREKELNQTNQDILSVEDAGTVQPSDSLEKMNKNGEEKSNGLTGNDKPICGSSSSSPSKCLQKGVIERVKDVNNRNKGKIPIEEADTTELNDPSEKMMIENGGKESTASKMRRRALDLEARVTKLEKLVVWMKAGNLDFGQFENLQNKSM